VKTVFLLVLLSFIGCDEKHRDVYGAAGPGLQDNIYHPQEDPLIKGDK
jgi:hypothetical protein